MPLEKRLFCGIQKSGRLASKRCGRSHFKRDPGRHLWIKVSRKTSDSLPTQTKCTRCFGPVEASTRWSPLPSIWICSDCTVFAQKITGTVVWQQWKRTQERCPVLIYQIGRISFTALQIGAANFKTASRTLQYFRGSSTKKSRPKKKDRTLFFS